MNIHKLLESELIPGKREAAGYELAGLLAGFEPTPGDMIAVLEGWRRLHGLRSSVADILKALDETQEADLKFDPPSRFDRTEQESPHARIFAQADAAGELQQIVIWPDDGEIAWEYDDKLWAIPFGVTKPLPPCRRSTTTGKLMVLPRRSSEMKVWSKLMNAKQEAENAKEETRS